MIKSITTSEIIVSQYKTKAKKEREYLLNKELLLFHMKLDKYTNKKALNYDVDILKLIDYKFEDTIIYNHNVTIFDDGDIFDSE